MPVIHPNGVVNAASNAGSVKGEAVVVGGAIFSILGENLAVSEEKASGTPLPTTLSGTSVTVDGIPAPLFYVSPGRINFQVPHVIGKRVGERIPVVVTTDAGASDPVPAFVQPDSGGIFTQEGGGCCGQGLVQNAAADGRPVWNSPSESASPGGFITIYGTGLGPPSLRPPTTRPPLPPYSPPADGYPASVEPYTRLETPHFFLGIEGFQQSFGVNYMSAGLTPGLVGVNQVIVQLADDALEGCAVPLRIGGIWDLSAPVLISIRKGGGPCQDAPTASFANIGWRRVITTSAESPSGVEEATFTASFASAPENLAAPNPDPPDVPFRGCRCGGLSIPYSPRCKTAGLTALDAGTLTIEGVPGEPPTLLPLPPGEQIGYSTSLPPGSLEGGTLRVTGGGGAEVGVFQTDLAVPPPIQVTTSLAPGTVIDYHRPFTVTWTGGNPDMLVRMQLIAYRDQEGVLGKFCDCPALAIEGRATVNVTNPDGKGPVLNTYTTSENAEVVLTVTPITSNLTRFDAPGLTREGRHEWSYEYRFKGLKIR